MITRINTSEASAATIVEVTPDDLIIIARRMHIEAAKALPGEEVLVPVTERITFKYNPEITTALFSNRPKQSLPGTAVSDMMESKIADIARKEDLVAHGKSH